MKTKLLPFDVATFKDALSVTRQMFKLDCSELLHLALENPVRKAIGAVAGEVAYQDDVAVGFQAAVVRRLCYSEKTFLGIVGSTLCMKPEASPVLLMHLMRATIAPRAESKIFFSNTANPQSMKMNRLLGVKGAGPASCEKTRFSVLNIGGCVRIVTHGRFPRWLAYFMDAIFPLRCMCGRKMTSEKVVDINDAAFDAFWKRYLSVHDGIVSSRTAEELRWVFGTGIKTGRNVLLVQREDGRIVGYIMLLASDEERLRWRIVDWIAIGDDRIVLEGLLRDAVAFLRRQPHAAMLESIGFNMSVQDILARHLRFTRKNPNNSFIYKITDSALEAEMKLDFDKDWFWGPYDGDRCLG